LESTTSPCVKRAGLERDRCGAVRRALEAAGVIFIARTAALALWLRKPQRN